MQCPKCGLCIHCTNTFEPVERFEDIPLRGIAQYVKEGNTEEVLALWNKYVTFPRCSECNHPITGTEDTASAVSLVLSMRNR